MEPSETDAGHVRLAPHPARLAAVLVDGAVVAVLFAAMVLAEVVAL
jgi:uncharacterized RDD family membrane protein YckC